MKEDIRWLPGALVCFGGICTAVNAGVQIGEARERAENATIPIDIFASSFIQAFSGVLIFPMIIGMIAVILGFIMTRKNFIGLAIITLFLSFFTFSLIGFFFTVTGSILGLFIWRIDKSNSQVI